VIASSSCSVMAVHSSGHLRRRQEGYLRSDLLAATFRSNCKFDVFVSWMTPKKFLAANHPPTPSRWEGAKPGTMPIGDATCVRALAQPSFNTCVRMTLSTLRTKKNQSYKMDTYTGKPFILFYSLYSIRSSSAPALIGWQDYSNLFFPQSTKHLASVKRVENSSSGRTCTLPRGSMDNMARPPKRATTDRHGFSRRQ
jgi:hypothetical protein